MKKIHFGHFIEQLILEQQITKGEFANRLGINRKTLWDIVNREDLNTQILHRISVEFEIDIYKRLADISKSAYPEREEEDRKNMFLVLEVDSGELVYRSNMDQVKKHILKKSSMIDSGQDKAKDE